MEQFDILDINGNPMGLKADKGTQLKEGQYYLGVHVYIYNSFGEFLLQQRSYNKAFLPGGWDVVLEHVIAGETSKEAALRGIAEEVGLCVLEGNLNLVKRFVWEDHIVDVYFVKADFNVNDLKLQSREVIGAKMASKLEMLGWASNMDYRPSEYREYIANAIKGMKFD